MIFKPLTPQDYPVYRPYFGNQRYPLAAYSLPSIIAWSNAEYKPYGAEIDGAFLVAAEFETKTHHRHLILPVSPQRMFTPEELAEVAERAGHQRYWFVPRSYVDHFGDDAINRFFTVDPQPAYDDYVYRVDDLAKLRGSRYSKKRNLIKQFKRSFVEPGKVAVEPIAPDNIEACLAFLDQWCDEHDCDAEDQLDLACEKQAAVNTLLHLDLFDLEGILLRIGGKVSAFGIAAPLTDDMATLQYEKAFGSIKGLYQYFDNACARQLFNGYTFLNKESDMGIPGLAKAKRSYHPVKMVRSLNLTLKS